MLPLIYVLNSFSIFTTSLLNLVSVRLQRSVSLFAPSVEFSCSFNWEWFLSFFILLIFFLFCEFRKNNYHSLGGLFIRKSAPGWFCEGLLFVCGMRAVFGLDACCLFPQCVQAVISLIGCCACFQGVGAMGRASSQCLVAGLLTVARTLGKVARLSQFAGPLEVAVTLKQV